MSSTSVILNLFRGASNGKVKITDNHMLYILIWASLVFVSMGLIFLGRWVKKEAQVYALIGLTIIEVSLILALSTVR